MQLAAEVFSTWYIGNVKCEVVLIIILIIMTYTRSCAANAALKI